jgi:hypothetical protein
MEEKERYNLYKEFYRQELAIRSELDAAVNIPIILLSAIVGLHVYVFSKPIDPCTRFVLTYVSVLSGVAILVAIYFLGRSFTNLGRSYDYDHIPGINEYHKYYKELEEKKQTDFFTAAISDKLADAAGKNFSVNKERRESLAQAKRALFWGVVFSLGFAFIFIININNMADKNQTTENSGTPETGTQNIRDIVMPPQNVSIKNHMEKEPVTIVHDTPLTRIDNTKPNQNEK